MAYMNDCISVSKLQTKFCNGCKTEKPTNDFSKHSSAKDGLRTRCKVCESTATAEYRKRNPEKVKEYSELYKKRNLLHLREKARSRAALLRKENPERCREAKRRWGETTKGKESKRRWRLENLDRERQYSEKRRSAPKYRIEASIRSQVISSIKRGSKSGRRTFEILGYTSQQLKEHLERQFLKGMSWGNYGKEWQIDHILPLSMFEYQTPDDPDFRMAWALTNLRPLAKVENIRKSGKRLHLI